MKLEVVPLYLQQDECPSAWNSMDSRILLLDSERDELALLEKLLRTPDEADGVEIVSFTSAEKALAWCRQHEPDICLIGCRIPDVDGIEFLKQARALPGFKGVPMLIITDAAESQVRQRALLSGATGFISRPIVPADLTARVSNLLSLRLSLVNPRDKVEQLVRDMELVTREAVEREHEQIIHKLSRLSCCRDEGSENHMRRVAHVAQFIARELGCGAQFGDLILLAAPMHDIGKVGIPDRILFKPGRLTTEEWEIMRTHTTIGYEVLKDSSSQLLRMGAEIAHSHHEKYEGTGYPRAIAGEVIPLSGRIVAVADEFDALRSTRPYKKAWDLEESLALLRSERGRHFDPACVDVMLRHVDYLVDIEKKYTDEDEDENASARKQISLVRLK